MDGDSRNAALRGNGLDFDLKTTENGTIGIENAGMYLLTQILVSLMAVAPSVAFAAWLYWRNRKLKAHGGSLRARVVLATRSAIIVLGTCALLATISRACGVGSIDSPLVSLSGMAGYGFQLFVGFVFILLQALLGWSAILWFLEKRRCDQESPARW